jgi:methylmalonyl-CoA mutase N-terminal domain/subunit
MHYEMLKHTGEYPIIGVNTFRNPHGDPVPETRAGALTEEEKQSQLSAWPTSTPATPPRRRPCWRACSRR